MIRRQFIRMATLVGAGGLSSLSIAASEDKKTITYRIKGFSCITCAVGLDAILEKRKGVAWSKSSYPEAKTTICFNPTVVSEQSLKDAIADMGFGAELLN